MRTRIALLTAVAMFGFGWSANRVFSQDMGGEKKAEEAPAGMPTPEEMKAWMEAMTPGEPHKKMAEQAGEWTTASKMWMDPKAAPMESKGTASIRMILGGRFQVSEIKGEVMGMPFEGFGVAGYDNTTKEYVHVWMDNMGTMMVMSKGKADEKGVVVARGEMVDPMHPEGPPCKFRMVSPPGDKDSFKFEMHATDSKHPEEFKCMELDYTRKK